MAAHLHAKPGNLLDAAGDQRRLCVVPTAKAVGNARRQRHHIFQGRPKLNAKHIRTGIDAEYLAHEDVLDILRRFLPVGARHDGGGHPLSHLLRMGRAGKDGHLCLGNLFFDNLGKGEKGLFLNTLRHIYDDLPVMHQTFQLLRGAAGKRRGYRKHKKIHPFHRFGKLRGENRIRRKDHTRELILLLMIPFQHLDFRLQRRPHRHMMSIICKKPGQRRSPASRSDHSYFCHHFISSLFFLNR